MQYNFPYSELINKLYKSIKQRIGIHGFINVWQVSDQQNEISSQSDNIAISELYY